MLKRELNFIDPPEKRSAACPFCALGSTVGAWSNPPPRLYSTALLPRPERSLQTAVGIPPIVWVWIPESPVSHNARPAVTGSGGFIVSDRDAVPEFVPLENESVITEMPAVVGVPEMSPVVGATAKPAGKPVAE